MVETFDRPCSIQWHTTLIRHRRLEESERARFLEIFQNNVSSTLSCYFFFGFAQSCPCVHGSRREGRRKIYRSRENFPLPTYFCACSRNWRGTLRPGTKTIWNNERLQAGSQAVHLRMGHWFRHIFFSLKYSFFGWNRWQFFEQIARVSTEKLTTTYIIVAVAALPLEGAL